MWTLPEFSNQLSPVQGSSTTPSVFFSIWYKVTDNAFQYAAKTWRRVVESRPAFQHSPSSFLEYEVGTEAEFTRAWVDVGNKAGLAGAQVRAGNLLTHASIQGDGHDGLEFHVDHSTVKCGEIHALPLLPWGGEGAHLILSSCNSGKLDSRSWCPARALAGKQRVATIGQAGFAYFSRTWDTYTEKRAADRRIGLWAYSRRRNGWLGSGQRMPGVVFAPHTAHICPTPAAR